MEERMRVWPFVHCYDAQDPLNNPWRPDLIYIYHLNKKETNAFKEISEHTCEWKKDGVLYCSLIWWRDTCAWVVSSLRHAAFRLQENCVRVLGTSIGIRATRQLSCSLFRRLLSNLGKCTRLIPVDTGVIWSINLVNDCNTYNFLSKQRACFTNFYLNNV